MRRIRMAASLQRKRDELVSVQTAQDKVDNPLPCEKNSFCADLLPNLKVDSDERVVLNMTERWGTLPGYHGH
jgi:hypothetical protein